MRLLLNTLTPVWTGGPEGFSDRLRETGIIGSLRWWYELITRVCGGAACDPTNDSPDVGRCPAGTYEAKQWCDACEFFGSTGLRRKFRLSIDGGRQVYEQKEQRASINVKPQRGKVANHGWFEGAGLVTDSGRPLNLSVSALSGGKQTELAVSALLRFVSTWAGIGARLQHGYGVVEIAEGETPEPDMDKQLEALVGQIRKTRPSRRIIVSGPTMPSLSNFFFAKYRLSNLTPGWRNLIDGKPVEGQQAARFDEWHKTHESAILAPALKNQLRFVLLKGNLSLQESLFGFARPDRKQAARLVVSHAYPVQNDTYEVRVWGEAGDAGTRDKIYSGLSTRNPYWTDATGSNSVSVTCAEWREMGGASSRCSRTCTSPCTDGVSLLRCLLI